MACGQAVSVGKGPLLQLREGLGGVWFLPEGTA
jgi:hypothetical protein